MTLVDPFTPFCGCKGHHTPGGCPVEPFAFEPKPALAADFVDRMLGDIRTKVVDNRFEDDALTPDLLGKVLNDLRIASQTEGVLGLWAGNLLQALWHRAESGVPFGEPVEPAWSLDPERSHRGRASRTARTEEG